MTPAADLLGVRPFAEVARGPVASVFKAYDAVTGTAVLLKALRPAAAADPERRDRFAEEARLASRVDHPNVVHVLRVAPDGSALVAEWVEGRDLQTLLDERGGLPAGLAALVLREAARGLDAVHAEGIVHRDVKPANVILGDDGSVRLTDFGLASLTPDADAQGTEVRGTLATLAPEIVRGAAAGPASDVFSLGAVAAHMLSGRPPFDAATASDTLDAVLHVDAAAALAADPRVPEPLSRVVGPALHRDPAARPTARALADALDALIPPDLRSADVAACFVDASAPPPSLRPQAGSARPPAGTSGGPVARTARRHAVRAGGLALAALGVVSVAALLVWQRPAPAADDRTEPLPRRPLVLAPTPQRGPTAPPETPSAELPQNAERADQELALLDAPDPAERPAPQAAASQAAVPEPEPAVPSPADLVPQTPSPAPPPTASPPGEAELRPGTLVATTEPWATLTIDGRRVGTTPVRTALPAGTHELTFENPGFPPHRRTVRIEPGETTQTELSLWSLVARVTLDVAPWAEVWVDGELWDTVPPQARPLVLTPGDHTLRFEHPTLGRRDRTLRVAAGEARTLRVRMTDPAP